MVDWIRADEQNFAGRTSKIYSYLAPPNLNAPLPAHCRHIDCILEDNIIKNEDWILNFDKGLLHNQLKSISIDA